MTVAHRIEERGNELDPVVVNELGKLACLGALRHGIPVYYASLLTARDETARIAAMSALLELGVLLPVHWSLAVDMSVHNGVRARAFKFFMARYEYDLAKKCADTSATSEDSLRSMRMEADLKLDTQACLDLNLQLFRATGSIEHLHDAQRCADTIGGWKAALPWAVMSILALPTDPRGPYSLFRLLLAANQIDFIEHLCSIFRTAGVYPREATVYGAMAGSSRGRAKEAIKALNDLPTVPGGDILKAVIPRAKALAFEGLGQFKQAYNSFVQMNEVDPLASNAHAQVIKATSDRGNIDFGSSVPADPKTNHFMMVGFPRSGTTLLENALAAHPDIETFEEIPSYASAAAYLDRHAKPGVPLPTDVVTEARRRYYAEIERRSVKTSARLFIDKMPMSSAACKTLEKLLPAKRYIFSIRHPYDVVLSCFKQNFVRNAAMESFRRFPDACRLYDFSMTQWFDTFSLGDSDRVTYVRYDQLVTDFQATTTRVLRFVGADWDDNVMDFAAHSNQRAARTPSYQKVRAGLSVGVQSSWQNYAFLFQGKDAEPLKRWVTHFGYEGL